MVAHSTSLSPTEIFTSGTLLKGLLGGFKTRTLKKYYNRWQKMMEEPRGCNLSSILSLKWGNTPQLKESFDSNAHPMKQSSHGSSAPAGEQSTRVNWPWIMYKSRFVSLPQTTVQPVHFLKNFSVSRYPSFKYQQKQDFPHLKPSQFNLSYQPSVAALLPI